MKHLPPSAVSHSRAVTAAPAALPVAAGAATKKRAHISLKTKLASALCQLRRYDEENAQFVRVIPYEKAKLMTEDEILAVFDFHHHPIPKAHDGPDVHWNLEPVEKAKHREVTATIDVPTIAKGKRIERSTLGHRARMLAKLTGVSAPIERTKRKIPKRANPWPPKGSRKMQSRSVRS